MVNPMHLLLRDCCAQVVVVRPYLFGRFVRQVIAHSHWRLSRPQSNFEIANLLSPIPSDNTDQRPHPPSSTTRNRKYV
jgi:hypothetical protein